MRKGRFFTALIFLLLVCVTVEAGLVFPFETVTNDKVNMRRSASSASTILERLDKGDALTVISESGNYFRVKWKDRTGYILKKYINTEKDVMVTPEVETVSSYPYTTVTTDKVNLRKAKSSNSAILRKIPSGASVTVRSVSGSYAAVTYSGTEGYVKTDYIVLKKVVKPTATPTAVPTLTPEEDASGYSILKKGSVGDDVTTLQQALSELGFLSGTADGSFGSGTEKAVIAFQNANDYPATGVVDANLQAFLYSGKPKNAAGTAVKIKTVPAIGGVTIQLNNTGLMVSRIQIRLRELGYYAGETTGVYDTAVKSAIKAFQKKNDLKADGICGYQTQKLLLNGTPLSADATPTPTPTPKPTAVPTFEIPSETVKSGSEGTSAKQVQKRLKQLGYYKGAVDGKFGGNSVKALKTFQTANNLNADGVAGKSTYEILFSLRAIGANTTPSPAPTLTPTAAPDPTKAPVLTKENAVLITLGVSGDAVLSLQQRLTDLGYYEAAMDGECKADDVAAIKAFQKQNGLKQDGKAGYDTQTKLYSAAAIMASGALAAGTVDQLTVLKKGSVGTAVTTLQERLIELGYLDGEADGNYGTATASAIIAFQKANDLVRDGKAGTLTQTKLYSATAIKASAVATATPAPSNGTLRQGDASTAVKELQERLIELGYLSGKADGKFGILTANALKAFQRNNKLTADGIAGAKTIAKLESDSAVNNSGVAPAATPVPQAPADAKPKASQVKYANWYTTVKAIAKKYPYVTVYDFSTGISWQLHIFSLGAHADAEPVTAADTAKLERAFGGNTWNPKAVWVVFGDGSVYLGSTHSMPHEVQHNTANNFNGHLCIHFPRTQAQVTAIGPYATSHQKAIDEGWSKTQSMIK